METDRALRYEAARRFRGIENIRKGLQWIRQNPDGFRIRACQFDDVVEEMMRTMIEHANPQVYPNLVVLEKAIQGSENQRLTLKSTIERYRLGQQSGKDDLLVKLAEETFLKVKQNVATGEWQFPTEITDNPNMVALGFLIEGFGLLVESAYQKPGLARNFVLGFEEVLIAKYPHYRLLGDVIGWMREEKACFSEPIKRLIDKAI